tara:strand:- start:307 stop:1626 length:1320 start_codon:yes stop_codon:yes gene_type:complete
MSSLDFPAYVLQYIWTNAKRSVQTQMSAVQLIAVTPEELEYLHDWRRLEVEDLLLLEAVEGDHVLNDYRFVYHFEHGQQCLTRIVTSVHCGTNFFPPLVPHTEVREAQKYYYFSGHGLVVSEQNLRAHKEYEIIVSEMQQEFDDMENGLCEEDGNRLADAMLTFDNRYYQPGGSDLSNYSCRRPMHGPLRDPWNYMLYNVANKGMTIESCFANGGIFYGMLDEHTRQLAVEEALVREHEERRAKNAQAVMETRRMAKERDKVERHLGQDAMDDDADLYVSFMPDTRCRRILRAQYAYMRKRNCIGIAGELGSRYEDVGIDRSHRVSVSLLKAAGGLELQKNGSWYHWVEELEKHMKFVLSQYYDGTSLILDAMRELERFQVPRLLPRIRARALKNWATLRKHVKDTYGLSAVAWYWFGLSGKPGGAAHSQLLVEYGFIL